MNTTTGQMISGTVRMRAFQVNRFTFWPGRGVNLAPAKDNDTKKQRKHKPGDDAGKKQLANRLLCNNPEYDKYHAWRNENTKGPNRRNKTSGQGLVVFEPFHFRDGNTGKSCYSGCA